MGAWAPNWPQVMIPMVIEGGTTAAAKLRRLTCTCRAPTIRLPAISMIDWGRSSGSSFQAASTNSAACMARQKVSSSVWVFSRPQAPGASGCSRTASTTRHSRT